MITNSYYSKTKKADLEISAMVDYHARNAYAKELQLMLGSWANESKSLSNSEFGAFWKNKLKGLAGEEPASSLLSHIGNCSNRSEA